MSAIQKHILDEDIDVKGIEKVKKRAEQQLTNYKTLPDPSMFKNHVVDFKNRLANTKVPDAFSQNALSSV